MGEALALSQACHQAFTGGSPTTPPRTGKLSLCTPLGPLISMARRGRTVFTVGYQGRTLEDFCALIVSHEIAVVVDVRLTPWSRRPGFAKRSLSDALAQAGVDYVHEPTLGNPRDNREAFRSGDQKTGRAVFLKVMRATGAEALRGVADRIASARTALLCVESEDARCHRQVIVDILSEMAPGLQVQPL